MLREPEGAKVFEKKNLSADPIDLDEVNIDVQKGYVTKDTSGTLSSANRPISVAEPKTTFIQHGLKICFENKNNLLCILKCLPTHIITDPSTIWRWDQVQVFNCIVIR